jgi:phage tail-like protein
MAGERHDPFLTFQFRVEADHQVLGSFNEITGLEVETEVEKFVEGGVNGYEQQLAGLSKYPSRLVLKRGMTDSKNLWSWYQDVMRGKITRRTISIYLLDSTGTEKANWVFQGAVPVKWSGPHLHATASEVAIESVELVHKGLVPG